MAAGAVTIVAGLLDAQLVMLPALLVAAIIPVVYSAVIHRRLEDKAPDDLRE